MKTIKEHLELAEKHAEATRTETSPEWASAEATLSLAHSNIALALMGFEKMNDSVGQKPRGYTRRK